MKDDENPTYIFFDTHNTLLSQIAKGEIDPVRLAKDELENRGCDINGKWAGFEKGIA